MENENVNQGMYIPSKAAKEEAYKIYNEVIIQQVLRPEAIKTAYQNLFGEVIAPNPVMKKQVFFYFQNEKNLDFLNQEEQQVPEFVGDKRSNAYKEYKIKYNLN